MKDISFNERMREALVFYGLEASDLAYLIRSNSANIINIMEGKAGLAYAKMELISKVFGLRYYEFGNPKNNFLPIEKLASEVQDVILKRKERGVVLRDATNEVANELDRLINTKCFNTPITAAQVFLRMKLTDGNRKNTIVTNLLRKPPRNNNIKVLENGGKNRLVFIHKNYYNKYKDLTKSELMKLIESNI